MSADFLIYGAYGYTGRLVAELAIESGLRPVLAGRDEGKLKPLSDRLGLEARCVALEDPDALDSALRDVALVAHCAGPFSRTALPMAQACLRTGAHYLDITGEISVFETLAALDAQANDAGVMLLPGAGLDVVPSDCLAVHLAGRLPGAERLTLALHSSGNPSHGTALTMLEYLPQGGRVREDGFLRTVPLGHKRMEVDFGGERHTAVCIPWGDVSSAFYSTGIGNIEVYMSAPAGLRATIRALRALSGLMASARVQAILRRIVPAGGPSAEARATGYCLLWGAVEDGEGNREEARLRTPDGYSFTAGSVVSIARKVLAGAAPAGFQTPAKAYGADSVLEIEGVTRY